MRGPRLDSLPSAPREIPRRQVPAFAEPAIKISSLVIEWKKGTTGSKATSLIAVRKHPGLIDYAIARRRWWWDAAPIRFDLVALRRPGAFIGFACMRNIKWRDGYWYNTVYLRTSHWKKVHMAGISRAGGRCENCWWRRATVVHHLNYLCLFDERPEDVVALCVYCHEQIHRIPQAANDNERQLPLPLPHPPPRAASDNEVRSPLPRRMGLLPKAANDNQLPLPTLALKRNRPPGFAWGPARGLPSQIGLQIGGRIVGCRLSQARNLTISRR